MGPISFCFRSIGQYVSVFVQFLYTFETVWLLLYVFYEGHKNLVFMQIFRFKMAAVQNIQS